jgi:hypothetical protein
VLGKIDRVGPPGTRSIEVLFGIGLAFLVSDGLLRTTR